MEPQKSKDFHVKGSNKRILNKRISMCRGQGAGEGMICLWNGKMCVAEGPVSGKDNGVNGKLSYTLCSKLVTEHKE